MQNRVHRERPKSIELKIPKKKKNVNKIKQKSKMANRIQWGDVRTHVRALNRIIYSNAYKSKWTILFSMHFFCLFSPFLSPFRFAFCSSNLHFRSESRTSISDENINFLPLFMRSSSLSFPTTWKFWINLISDDDAKEDETKWTQKKKRILPIAKSRNSLFWSKPKNQRAH